MTLRKGPKEIYSGTVVLESIPYEGTHVYDLEHNDYPFHAIAGEYPKGRFFVTVELLEETYDVEKRA